MSKILIQEDKYLNKNITSVFHLLSIYGHNSKLIGSSKIRNILYNNDYDLNENFKVNDTTTILKNLYNEFLNIFHKCYNEPNYYIIDFKCGEINNEPIRWTYDDMKCGYKIINKIKYLFTECLKMNDTTIKIDIVYLLYGIQFTDITNNYFITIVNTRQKIKSILKEKKNDKILQLNKDAKELVKEGEFYKALKRKFSISLLLNKPNLKLLNLFNSDIGRFYKVIHDLNMCVLMLHQTFKPISVIIITENIQIIKQFCSNITDFKIENILSNLNNIVNLKNKKMMITQLTKLIENSKNYLNTLVKKYVN